MRKFYKTIGYISLICLTFCYFTLLTSENYGSFQIKQHTNEIDMNLQAVHEIIMVHYSQNADAKCLKKEGRVCLNNLKSHFATLTRVQQQAFAQKLQQQGEQFKQWANSAQNPRTVAGVDNYINRNFAHDPVTGQFWTCIIGTFPKCNLHDEELQLNSQSIHDLIMTHYSQSADAKCLKRESKVCLNNLKSHFTTLTPTQQQAYAQKLQQQGQQFKQWANSAQNPRTLAGLDNYINQNFARDPLTGQFWTCIIGTFPRCNLHDEELQMNMQSVHDLIMKHYSQNADAKCLKKEGRVCLNNLKSHFSTLTRVQQQAFVQKLKQQGEQFKQWADSAQNPRTVAGVDNYINRNFAHDPVTGQFWTCIIGTFPKCNLHDEELQLNSQSIHDLIMTHYSSGSNVEACLKREQGSCLNNLKQHFRTLTANQQQQYAQKLQQQNSQFQSWTQNTQTRTVAALNNYIRTNFARDPVTGQFWTCVQGSLSTCNVHDIEFETQSKKKSHKARRHHKSHHHK